MADQVPVPAPAPAPAPTGASLEGGVARFALTSRSATAVWLELFDEVGIAPPARRIPMGRGPEDRWSVEVPGLAAGQLYAFRVEGPWNPRDGQRHDPSKLLLDPEARALAGNFDWESNRLWSFDRKSADKDRDLARKEIDSLGGMARCVLVGPDGFDWQGDRRPRTPWERTVIYEAHVRGFTRHSSSGVRSPGTFLGLTEKARHIRELGATAVELLPIQEFDAFQHRRDGRTDIRNYWGYNTLAFFAPNRAYATTPDGVLAIREFKTMVRELHAVGLEVLMDVVFNHTPESDELGPTVSFRGIDNTTWYILDGGRLHQNHSGCGNTLNANHPAARDFILRCLRYWATEMRVDGFRFDLAGAFWRDGAGKIMADPPLVREIAALARELDFKIIAEPWDATGSYRLGAFPEPWREWNGRYRDEVRLFWRGQGGMVRHLATRIMGSSDFFTGARYPLAGVNFITAHDGFTLRDLVTYEKRRNEDNGEQGRDGEANNHSCNWGAEGETDDRTIIGLRQRALRNFMATLLVSRGVPMLLAGDEFLRTQRGNNNAYCQDNDISWVDWTLAPQCAGFTEYVRRLLRFRRTHPFLAGPAADPQGTARRVEWFDAKLSPPIWEDPELRSVAVWIHVPGAGEGGLFLVFNASPALARQDLPATAPGKVWRRVLDTSLDDQQAMADESTGNGFVRTDLRAYGVAPRSMVLLEEG